MSTIKIILYSSNFLEHLDSYIYIFLVPLIAKPLGAALFGLLAVNRSPILVVSYGLTGVAITALLIAILPSYANIGYLSSVGLFLLELLVLGVQLVEV